ncbi:tRNA adenosine(34) deaminase TadA [Intestinimonas massiliensis]|uniref:tRNA-specific adenosine deaminase n=1 Tax=Intestinimonas massiliensis (ex Afouda et al. 2020) TaxID=1673721 RepID=A0AAW5JI43_9FIRM|nr:tRNA adenosine(34) deaminase TadA [Intestinimonas massiliensis (ex Afouda et al. 2020)]MCQ4769731.1 tRNA adenosine(34) deaminase TadA [Intestinimonas massiliensis (ex Afouda et al. 2020)]
MEREEYMRQALALAEEAAGHGDVPVGCVVVKDGAVIGRGCNRREERGDAVAHAEVEAIRQACRAVGGWNLHDCALYVTLEPCPMCAGAIINARVGTVCYGARDEKAGACGSVLDLFAERFNHRPRVYGGVLKEACAALLRDFFHNLRKNSPDFPQN